MRVLFDLDLDDGAWPGPLGAPLETRALRGRSRKKDSASLALPGLDLGEPSPASTPRHAAFGDAWVGAGGFLGILETSLGLGGPAVPRSLRIAALLRGLRVTDGFWRASADADPLGTAAALLGLRDTLVSHGWSGQPTTPRLADLARLVRDLPPGPPDRLAAAQRAVDSRSPDLERVTLLRPLTELPRPWRSMLEALERHGTRLDPLLLPDAPAKGDLFAARAFGFTPAGDASLELVRAAGPLQAAEDVAAWLAALPSLEGVVIVSPDSVLDAALRRFGLPTTGAPGSPRDDVLLEVLPLVLELGWDPPDPARVLELLTIPVGPVPRAVARPLVDALHQFPAVGSPNFRVALDQGLARIEDPGRRKRVAERLQSLLWPSVARGDRYPTKEIARRTGALLQWLVARETVDEAADIRWDAAISQCAGLAALVEAAGVESLAPPELRRYVDLATSEAPRLPPYGAEAGLAAVGGPGALVGPARRVIWWGFTRDSAPAPKRLPLSEDEQSALAHSGVVVPDPVREAMARASRARRPLFQATEGLLLVCPEHDAAGEELHPHPLWDELSARTESGIDILIRRTPRAASPPPNSRRALRPLPTPRRDWHVPTERIARRSTESPSSTATLVGCSFKWVAEYVGRLRIGESAELPADSRLLGIVAHELLAGLLRDRKNRAPEAPSTPEEAREKAVERFRRDGPNLAASLFLPGAEALRATAEKALSEAARLLFSLLAGGRSIRSVEEPYRTEAFGTTLEGTPDLVLDAPLGVVDLKYSGGGYYLRALKEGTAHQLASYSFLVGRADGAPLPAVAYLVLDRQQLLSTGKTAFPDAEPILGPPPDVTWEAFSRAHAEAWQALESGRAIATANSSAEVEEPPTESSFLEDRLVLEPPCRFCNLDAVCGRAFAGEGR